jgi:hypothetical protein
MVILLYIRKVPNFYPKQLPPCAVIISTCALRSSGIGNTSFQIFTVPGGFNAALLYQQAPRNTEIL